MPEATTELPAPAALREQWYQLSEQGLASQSPARRFELTELGQAVPYPLLTSDRSTPLGQLCAQLLAQLGDEVLYSTAVFTPDGVLRPDLIWQPEASDNNPTWDLLDRAPPLVVELDLAGSPRQLSVAHRAQAFLQAGAEEVAVVAPGGETVFHHAHGSSTSSVWGIRLGLSVAALAQSRAT